MSVRNMRTTNVIPIVFFGFYFCKTSIDLLCLDCVISHTCFHILVEGSHNGRITSPHPFCTWSSVNKILNKLLSFTPINVMLCCYWLLHNYTMTFNPDIHSRYCNFCCFISWLNGWEEGIWTCLGVFWPIGQHILTLKRLKEYSLLYTVTGCKKPIWNRYVTYLFRQTRFVGSQTCKNQTWQSKWVARFIVLN